MKAKKLMALLLAMVMLVSCFASINVIAFDGTAGVDYFRFVPTDFERGGTDGGALLENGGAKLGWLGGDRNGTGTIYFTAGAAGTYNFEVSVTDYAANNAARALDAKVGEAAAVCVVPYGTATDNNHVMSFTLDLAQGLNTIVFGNLVASDGENANALGLEYVDVQANNAGDAKAINPAPANAVAAQIAALTAAADITVADKDAITAARNAYNALTDAQKALVSAESLNTLAAAEAALAAAEDAAFNQIYNKKEAEACETTTTSVAADSASGGAAIGGNTPLSFYYEVAETGTYDIAIISACYGARAYQINVYSYSANETYGPVNMNGINTNAWYDNWGTEIAQVTLTAGVNKVTFTENGAGYLPNLDYFGVQKKDGDTGFVDAPADPTVYYTIEAESGACVGIKPENNDELSGGQFIGGFNYNNGNNYVTYNYYAAEAGDYKLKISAANGDGANPRNNIFAVNGVEAATVVVGDTGGWAVFKEQEAVTITLAKGLNVIKMYTNAASGYASLASTDYIKIEKKSAKDIVLASGAVDYIDKDYNVTTANGPLPDGASGYNNHSDFADETTHDVCYPVWFYGEPDIYTTHDDNNNVNQQKTELVYCHDDWAYADDNGATYQHGFRFQPLIAWRVYDSAHTTNYVKPTYGYCNWTKDVYDEITIPVPAGATAFFTNYGRDAAKSAGGNWNDSHSKAEFYIGNQLVATAQDTQGTCEQVLFTIPENTTEIKIRVYVGGADNKHMMFADAMFIGENLVATKAADNYFDIATAAAAVAANDGSDITWSTTITAAADITIDRVNSDIVFKEYGAIYGVDADAVNACIVNGGEAVVEEGVTMAKSYAFRADSDKDGGIVVYDNFSFRLTGVPTGASRAATIYVKYSIGDKDYIAYSNVSSIDTAAE